MAAGPATYVPQAELPNKDRHPGISLALLEEIHTNPYQPRRDFDENAIEELAQSIRANGIIQPLIVRKRAQGGGWELIAGERRMRAAKVAGLKQVPIVIRRSTDRESLELALVENIQRQNLNCIDEALAYAQLAEDFTLTQEEVATRVGKERATVANYMRLLRLPEAVIDDLKKQILSFGHGKALLGVDDNDVRLQIRAQIVEKRLSVRDTEALVDQYKSKKGSEAESAQPALPTKPISALAARMFALSQELTRHWSARVDVKGSERRGKIVIHYASRRELERILETMKNRSL
ncbi:MAG: ParB/RepB/Spo0J family partition protein [Oligoflexia bacterium]|nr:ParB/RepB/Spo0J family partition protein [Oligoflexia bacterium]